MPVDWPSFWFGVATSFGLVGLAIVFIAGAAALYVMRKGGAGK